MACEKIKILTQTEGQVLSSYHTHNESETRILRQSPMNVARETTPNVPFRNAQSENIPFRSPRDAQLLSGKESAEARRQSPDPDNA